MSRLTRKEVKFKWDGDCQSAFDKLRQALCMALVLVYPRDSCLYILDTDVSNIGVGLVFSLSEDGMEKVIAYGSKKFDARQ